MYEEPTLVIDTREKDEDLIQKTKDLCEDKDIDVVEDALDSGDYVYYGPEATAAIEYKEISDAMNSCLNDRIYKQCNRLAEGDDYDRAFVYIVGKVEELRLHGRNIGYGQAYGQIKGMMPEVIGTMNIPVMWFQNSNEFVDIGIRSAIRAGDAGLEDNEKVLISPGVSSDSQQAVLMSIGRIGKSTAQDILEEFGSIRDVSEAEYWEIKDVSGVGSTTARQIYNTFNEDWNGPGFDAGTKDTPMFEFFDTSGVGSSIMRDIWKETNGLTEEPWEYFYNEYGDMGPSRTGKVEEAIEESLDNLGIEEPKPTPSADD